MGSKTNPENCFTNPLSHETAFANEELPLDLKKTKFPVPMCQAVTHIVPALAQTGVGFSDIKSHG